MLCQYCILEPTAFVVLKMYVVNLMLSKKKHTHTPTHTHSESRNDLLMAMQYSRVDSTPKCAPLLSFSRIVVRIQIISTLFRTCRVVVGDRKNSNDGQIISGETNSPPQLFVHAPFSSHLQSVQSVQHVKRLSRLWRHSCRV